VVEEPTEMQGRGAIDGTMEGTGRLWCEFGGRKYKPCDQLCSRTGVGPEYLRDADEAAALGGADEYGRVSRTLNGRDTGGAFGIMFVFFCVGLINLQLSGKYRTNTPQTREHFCPSTQYEKKFNERKSCHLEIGRTFPPSIAAT